MNKLVLLLVLFCFHFYMFAQQDAWVYLVDKQNVPSSISNPLSILTQKAIDRKLAHGVSIDERDVPVNETHISQLKSSTGITVKAKSKWLNAVHVRGSETAIKNLKTTFSFIDQIVFADKSVNTNKIIPQKKQSKLESALTTFNYGTAANQIQMIKGDKLHLANYTGSGITVAVMDAGFPNVNTMTSFKRSRDAGKLLEDYDFVNRDNDVYANTTSNHGTLVLSTMAGYVENQYVGTAPDAAYYLFITEDALTENPVEESYWVEAAERADSLGVDVINTSLGYKIYDNPNYNYTNANLDGHTAFITKGANIAFEKGMLLLNSAGNEGNSGINAPADAAGVFTIGAVNSTGSYASFSSVGSTMQPTQKPDVVAQGQGSGVITENDIITSANGTSFSAPIMTGGIVCLWQALPSLNNDQIMQLVRASASQYNTPDYFLGYGIPNLQWALVNGLDVIGNNQDVELNIYPNPASEEVYVSLAWGDVAELHVFDVLGKLIIKTTVTASKPTIDISTLSKAMYIVKLQSSTASKTIKLIKQ